MSDLQVYMKLKGTGYFNANYLTHIILLVQSHTGIRQKKSVGPSVFFLKSAC